MLLLGSTLGATAALARAVPSTIEVVGDVNDVIRGIVPPGCATRRLRADAVRAGFIVGSPRDLESMGEMIMVNGHAFCCSTSANDLHATLSGPAVYTTGACLIPKGAVPTRRIGPLRDLSWSELCEAVARSSGGGDGSGSRGVVFTGIVHFRVLRAVQISAPPIFGEAIFSNRERYYKVPPEERAVVRCFVMGAASARIGGGVEKFLYAGGTGIAGRDAAEEVDVTHHTHALELDAACGGEDEISPETALGVYHLSGDAVVSEATIDVFDIGEVVEHTAGLEPSSGPAPGE